jgi:hypothetical protein
MKKFYVVENKNSLRLSIYDENEGKLVMLFSWEKVGPKLNLSVDIPQLNNVNMLGFTKSIQFANKIQEEIIMQKLGETDLTIMPIDVIHACFAADLEYIGTVNISQLAEEYST